MSSLLKGEKMENVDTKSVVQARMSAIFNEWAKRYAENPDEFDDILDDNGVPVDDYGDRCAIYFADLAREMDEKGLLPTALNQ